MGLQNSKVFLLFKQYIEDFKKSKVKEYEHFFRGMSHIIKRMPSQAVELINRKTFGLAIVAKSVAG
ncbi:MAG: hypothetical protein EA409_00915 [Saprospirales bacterium]|nr:MAG: hypothetical protein EA409_00915 [Saprospirales bacterium]